VEGLTVDDEGEAGKDWLPESTRLARRDEPLANMKKIPAANIISRIT
jgi:hypothetical protein